MPSWSLQVCLSPSRAHENGSNGEDSGPGVQVAIVKASTSLRTKIRGKVPPRLLTLFLQPSIVSEVKKERQWGKGGVGSSRCKKRHICTADCRICNLCMEGRDGHKHDGTGEGRKDVFRNHHQKVPSVHAVSRKYPHCNVREDGGDQAADECPHPQLHGWKVCAPFAGVVPEANLKGEVDENGQGHVLLREALVEEFQVGDSVVCLEADFRYEMDGYEGLYIYRQAVSDPAFEVWRMWGRKYAST